MVRDLQEEHRIIHANIDELQAVVFGDDPAKDGGLRATSRGNRTLLWVVLGVSLISLPMHAQELIKWVIALVKP